MNRALKRNAFLWVGALAWMVGTGAGLWALAAHTFVPGISGSPEKHWPQKSRLTRGTDGYTLVLALHPECPCSWATVDELDTILACTGTKLNVKALFIAFPELPEPVELSALWARTQRIKQIEVIKDEGGREVRQFDAHTSGEARLYGPDGVLLFHGGITGSHGPQADNPAEAAVIAWVNQGRQSSALSNTPVFGCSLWSETESGK